MQTSPASHSEVLTEDSYPNEFTSLDTQPTALQGVPSYLHLWYRSTTPMTVPCRPGSVQNLRRHQKPTQSSLHDPDVELPSPTTK